MLRRIKHLLGIQNGRNSNREIDPDEILLDSRNLPEFDTYQFEGRLEKPISVASLIFFGIFCLIIAGIYTSKVWALQIKDGDANALRSERNRLRHTLLFSERGIIYDRNNIELAWNVPGSEEDFSRRKYTDNAGFAHLLGYVKYPSKDTHGFYYRTEYSGADGLEKMYDETLRGKNGLRIVETDALGEIISESVLTPPVDGESVTLTIDSKLQTTLHSAIKSLAERAGFAGGAGVIMDVKTGEVLSLTSFPEYSPDVMADGSNTQLIRQYLNGSNKPFLNRVIDGLYTPGSIVKPFVALGALNEKVVSEYKSILSTGSISIPNPYFPDKPTVFKDWKAHGWVDMREAIAVSSDVYFYAVGGGYEDQKGLGIAAIDRYMKLFGFGEAIQDPFFGGAVGVVPTPEWKKENFDGEEWRIGNTYHTAIGQYGFQVSPIQVVRAFAMIANDGYAVLPKIVKENATQSTMPERVNIPREYFKVVKEGMRQGAIMGTAKGLNVPFVEVAGKTGTAELGVSKKMVNSWVVGFFPYDDPKYAFAVVMEKGPRENTIGATSVMREVLDWMGVYATEYFK
jgi:penicillin-binding protein 2